ncbi:hypothetical protein P4V41_02675 [Fictibacillus nanhaiensis]|uniref:hypothetical protein n=1 Tax=Fictibacillus nanhaiensis TaxID=742169 RepID=UPI002E1F8C58|nr:hypothetical protein [Fictibacillus nanhaiensis]
MAWYFTWSELILGLLLYIVLPIIVFVILIIFIKKAEKWLKEQKQIQEQRYEYYEEVSRKEKIVKK